MLSRCIQRQREHVQYAETLSAAAAEKCGANGQEKESVFFARCRGSAAMVSVLKLLEQTLKCLRVFHLSLSLRVFLPPTSVAIVITSNNPLWAISKTFTPVMWLQ